MKTAFPAASAAELQRVAEAESAAIGRRYPRDEKIDTSDIPEADEEWFKRAKLTMPTPTPNDLIIRLTQIESALTYITRNHGVLGLGANAVQQSLREEKDMIINKLKEFGEEKFPQS